AADNPHGAGQHNCPLFHDSSSYQKLISLNLVCASLPELNFGEKARARFVHPHLRAVTQSLARHLWWSVRFAAFHLRTAPGCEAYLPDNHSRHLVLSLLSVPCFLLP